jgi:hypothetical protein
MAGTALNTVKLENLSVELSAISDSQHPGSILRLDRYPPMADNGGRWN